MSGDDRIALNRSRVQKLAHEPFPLHERAGRWAARGWIAINKGAFKMAGDPRTGIITELLQDFIEERVRQFPTKVFDIKAVKRALEPTLKEAGTGIELGPGDDRLIGRLLDEHPFVIPAGGSPAAWKPGLDIREARRGKSVS